jgi:hypothetical protein
VPLSDREKRARQRLKDDFPHYAQRCLRIKDKGATLDADGGLRRLVLKDPQQHIHAQIEKQLRETGKVRALILKARQQGSSTYVEGRFYWKVSHRKGVNAYILTHEDPATQNLFKMAKTYHEHCPELVRPSTGASNANELVFDRLSSGYKVGTAGSKGTGRSSTIQYFHGSEVAYWPNAETHMAGVLQAVPDAPGTEVILESTSAGPNGIFWSMCMAAARGEGEYQLIFIPWFWSPEYRKPVPSGFQLTSDEEKYKAAHGIDDEQIAFRRAKIIELGGVDHFRREYPATVDEAFKASTTGALWTQALIDQHRVPELPKDATGRPIALRRVVVAVDPSGGAGKTNDEVGIITVALAENGHAYVLHDDSGKLTPNAWAMKAVARYERERADRIVGERNFGGDMVETTVRSVSKTASYKDVVASRGKAQRAEPVKALYEQGKIHHVGRFVALEDELTTWEPGKSTWSPNRLDAEVWAVTELMLGEDRGGGSRSM